MHQQHTQRRSGTLGVAPPRRPEKAKLWSHQDDLMAMRGKRVRIQFRDAQTIDVLLLEADQFSLKIQDDSYPSTMIVWKQDLSMISLAPADAG